MKLGTKDVLVDTRELPFGSDTVRIDSLAQLQAGLPERLRRGPRVLKQYRGHSGIGVWRVEAVDGGLLVRHAQRGSVEERVALPAFVDRMAPYFDPANGGHMVDQAWQPRLPEGMVRAYMVRDRVGGFGRQESVALHPSIEPGPRLYHGPELEPFQGLRRKLETQWVTLLREKVGLPADRLPLLWDLDFLFGEPGPGGEERYVLCEINVSSVSPFPPSCIPAIVAASR